MGLVNMTGWKSDTLEVIGRAPNDKYGNAMWECRCKCGKDFVANGHSIRYGHTKTCGCLQRDTASRLSSTHRMSKTPIFRKWSAMRQRCENPHTKAYKDYGAKGITVCAAWHDFDTFYRWAMASGYKLGLTIERKDNAKGYSPDNCTWATKAEQNRNTSRTHRIKDGDKVLTAAEVGRMIGVGRSTVAKWCREEHLETLQQAVERRDRINNPRYIPRF